jgi:hypothetical protein
MMTEYEVVRATLVGGSQNLLFEGAGDFIRFFKWPPQKIAG